VHSMKIIKLYRKDCTRISNKTQKGFSAQSFCSTVTR
jgi:hypothetical protein